MMRTEAKITDFTDGDLLSILDMLKLDSNRIGAEGQQIMIPRTLFRQYHMMGVTLCLETELLQTFHDLWLCFAVKLLVDGIAFCF